MFPDTYSQYDEEQAIAAYFDARWRPGREPERLRFIDIGAWSPKDFSNTRKLYEAGWTGVMIEPSPGPMLGLLKEYGNDPRVKLFLGAVSALPEILALNVTDDSVSTSDPATFEKWKKDGGYFGKMLVQAFTWTEINTWFGGFNFANIDAEGISVDLFHSMLASGAKPECVCVEFDDRLPELSQAATKARYKLLYSNGTNAVFGL